MIFNKHFDLEGSHAFLGASNYHWLNYDLDKLEEVYRNEKAKQYGTEIHELASKLIYYGKKLEDNKQTLSLFVNDAITYKMDSEVVLKYSDRCFGTADAISFRRNLLRIHDLKTGMSKTSEKQLMIYAALFCLEYKYKPSNIKIELRIYQNDTVRIYSPNPEEIDEIIRKIILFDKHLQKIESEDKLDL
jgi:hypothetical protein